MTKNLQCPCVSIKKNKNTQQQYKCKCEKSKRVNDWVSDLGDIVCALDGWACFTYQNWSLPNFHPLLLLKNWVQSLIFFLKKKEKRRRKRVQSIVPH